jgi:hypothetical protein
VRRRVRDHQRAELARVLAAARAQVVEVDVAASSQRTGTTRKPRSPRSRVGAVRGHRDQAHVALRSPRAAW